MARDLAPGGQVTGWLIRRHRFLVFSRRDWIADYKSPPRAIRREDPSRIASEERSPKKFLHECQCSRGRWPNLSLYYFTVDYTFPSRTPSAVNGFPSVGPPKGVPPAPRQRGWIPGGRTTINRGVRPAFLMKYDRSLSSPVFPYVNKYIKVGPFPSKQIRNRLNMTNQSIPITICTPAPIPVRNAQAHESR